MDDYFLWGCVRVKRKERESVVIEAEIKRFKNCAFLIYYLFFWRFDIKFADGILTIF